MKTLRIYPTSINDQFLDEAAEALRDGAIVIYPTDSFYALGCDALNNRAIETLCKFKGIDPRKEALSIVASDLSMASEYARIDNEAFRILRVNLPGPFTFLLPSATTLPKVFKGRHTVGIRIPDSPIATALAERLGHPMLSTTLTDDDGEGVLSPLSVPARAAAAAAVLIDGGDTPGSPTAVIDITDSRNPVELREGPRELN